MIYGSSKDQVLVKKINLKVWSLRDEIESVIEQQVQSGLIHGSQNDLSSIADEYTGKIPLEVINPSDEQELTSATEEEAPQAEEEVESGDKPEENTEEDTGEITEEEMAQAMQEDTNPKNIQIRQRAPSIPSEKVSHAKAIMSEIWINRMLFFSSRNFLIGQSVVIEFVVPQPFSLNGTISFCRECNPKSRIISEKKLAYRIAIEFSFLKPGERSILRTFLASIEPDEKAPPQVAAPAASDEEEEDDDDLSDFGL
jgi:hypothetical protein